MNNDPGKIKKWPFYILLFPVFFLFHGYAGNFRLISAIDTLLLSFAYIAGTLALTACLYLLYRDISRATLLGLIILAFDFFFGKIIDFLNGLPVPGFITKYSFLVPAFVILAVALFFIIKKRKTLFRMNYYLNTLLIILISIDAVLMITRMVGGNKPAVANYVSCDSCSKPDIYIIVLDEYAGAEELKDVFHYDNKPFLDSLAARGFQTIGNSSSNYNYTPYSTASFLDMNYLDPQKTKNVKGGYQHAINNINNNQTVGFFRSIGYRFFNCSPFTIGGLNSQVEGSFVPTNTKLITSGTFLSRLEKDVLPNMAERLNWSWYLKKTMYTTLHSNEKLYAMTKKIAETETEPKIVYTHLLMPHFPYYYDESGGLRPFEELRKSSLENKAHYLSYLKYSNAQMLALTDHLLAHSSKPPIIVLLSDHGYRQGNIDLKYFFSNLLSFHLPRNDYSRYSDTISNVNFMRLLLNNEFKQSLPLLENKTLLIDF